ncbi:MAG: HRDC domain-containing protein, partial [Rhodothermales bacterium]
DATLWAMVQHRPTNHDAFNELSGVGQVKLERYGDLFIDVIRQY